MLVEYLTKKSKKHFIAQVAESLDTCAYIVKFLKKSLMGKFFTFLNDEEMEIEEEQIIKKLSLPNLNIIPLIGMKLQIILFNRFFYPCINIFL